MPISTDLVTDLPADFEVFGQAVDTQMKTNADAATQKSTLTTKGDIYAATGTSTPARLGVGSNGTVLTADSAEASGVKWAAPASGGLTLISTTTLTGASVTLSSIPQTYKHLQIVVRNYRPANDNAAMSMQFNGVAGSYSSSGSNTQSSSIGSTAMTDIVTNTDNGTTQGLGFGTIPDYTNTTSWKMYEGYSFTNDDVTPTNYNFQRIAAVTSQTAAISSITFLTNSGNFTSGTVLLYGVS
jgi:hypothetical protein